MSDSTSDHSFVAVEATGGHQACDDNQVAAWIGQQDRSSRNYQCIVGTQELGFSACVSLNVLIVFRTQMGNSASLLRCNPNLNMRSSWRNSMETRDDWNQTPLDRSPALSMIFKSTFGHKHWEPLSMHVSEYSRWGTPTSKKVRSSHTPKGYPS